jgi:hypothetical protein
VAAKAQEAVLGMRAKPGDKIELTKPLAGAPFA